MNQAALEKAVSDVDVFSRQPEHKLRLVKAILFLVPTNFAQALVTAVAIFLGFTLPIAAQQVLWGNRVTSLTFGPVICFDPHEFYLLNSRFLLDASLSRNSLFVRALH